MWQTTMDRHPQRLGFQNLRVLFREGFHSPRLSDWTIFFVREHSLVVVDGPSRQNEDTTGLNDLGEKKVGPYSVDGYDADNDEVFESLGCFCHGCVAIFPGDRTKTKNPGIGQRMSELHWLRLWGWPSPWCGNTKILPIEQRSRPLD